MITYYSGSNTYNIHDEEVMIDLFMAKIIDSILCLREPTEPISFTLASELVSDYIDKYNHINKAGCRNIRDVAEFEAMRIRAGEEYTLAE
nr:MAG TPA: hypothetical protein [Caudoviricetes sp.]